MSEFTLIFYAPADTQAARLERAVSLTLTRERYTPFYTLEYSFIADDHGADINDFVSVRLMYGSTSIFYGRAASLRMTRRAGSDIISGRAFSFTKTLSTCDAVPGMMFDCTLADIIANNASMPNISLQQVSDSALSSGHRLTHSPHIMQFASVTSIFPRSVYIVFIPIGQAS